MLRICSLVWICTRKANWLRWGGGEMLKRTKTQVLWEKLSPDSAITTFRRFTCSKNLFPTPTSRPAWLSVLALGPAVSWPFFQFDNSQRGFPHYYTCSLSFIERFWNAIVPCPCKNGQRWEVKALREKSRINPHRSCLLALLTVSLCLLPLLSWRGETQAEATVVH